MPGSLCAAACLGKEEMEEMCESYAVNSRLLYNELEQMSGKRFQYAHRLVLWSQLLCVASVAAAGVCGLSVYYQKAQLHRVWRLRNPRKVQRLVHVAWTSGGFSVSTLLFLISPIGFMHLYEKELHRMKQLDAIAVTALIQEQNLRTTAAWARAAANASWSANAPTAPSSSSVATSPDTARRGANGEVTKQKAGPEPQWVWTNVVLDAPTELRQSPCNLKIPQQSKNPLDAIAAESLPTVDAAGAKADVAATKNGLSSALLIGDEQTAGSAGGDKGCASEDRLPTWRERPRRVWSRTAEPVELQQLMNECIDMWGDLVKEKQRISREIF